MATRKKTLAERQPAGQRNPRRETRTAAPTGRAPSRRAPAAPPGAGLSAAILQFPLHLTQSRASLSAGMTPAAERAHPAPASGNISRLPTPLPTASASVSKTPSVRRHFGELREALAEGFEIVQPIFARPLWTTPDDSATAFNFVLARERTTRLVIVPEGRTIQRFIRERHLTVDYRC